MKHTPTLKQKGLKGGVLFHDGQFDDARLAISLAQTAASHGGTLLNYMKVTGLLKNDKKICGIRLKDTLTGKEYDVRSKKVVNATGIFTDDILQMDNKEAAPVITLSQGAHIVLDKEFLPGDAAILIPGIIDGRVLFAVPWHNKTLVGTTDTPVVSGSLEPVPLKAEIEFILNEIGKYLTKKPAATDIRSIFAGLRPLVKGNAKRTAALPRDHLIQVTDSGLITVTGGKWTTYRRMAEDVVNMAITTGNLATQPCVTKTLHVHGSEENTGSHRVQNYYGTDAAQIEALITKDASLGEPIHASLPYLKAEIVWAVRMEMCITLDDALARRTRALLLDAKAAIEAAPLVAAIMAAEMHKDLAWQNEQVAAFTAVAKNYLPYTL